MNNCIQNIHSFGINHKDAAVHIREKFSLSFDDSKSIEEKSWAARIVALRTPWVFLDLNDDGSIQGRMHLRQLGKKQRLSVDEHGLNVIPSQPDDSGNQNSIIQLGQHYPCRLRGIDIWSGLLDLAPK